MDLYKNDEKLRDELFLQLQDNTQATDFFTESKTDLSKELKSSLWGGYSKKSVDDYIAKINGDIRNAQLQLEQQIRDISMEKANVARECSVLRTQLKEAEEALSDVREKAFQGEADLERFTNAEAELAEARSEIKKLYEVLDSRQTQTKEDEQYRIELEERNRDIEMLRQEIVFYQRELSLLQKRMVDLNEKEQQIIYREIHSTDTGNIEQEREARELAERELSVIREELASVRSQERGYAESKAILESYEKELSEKHSLIDSLHADIELYQKEKEDTQAELAMIREKLQLFGDIEKEYRDNKLLLETYQADLNNRDMENEALNRELEGYRNEKENAKVELSALQEEINKLRNIEQEYQSNMVLLSSVQEELLTKDTEKDALNRELESYRNEKENAKVELSALQEEINKLRNIEQEYQSNMVLLSSVQEELLAKNTEKDALNAEVANYQKELSELNQKIEELEKHSEEMENSAIEIQELQQLRQNAQDFEKRVESSKSALKSLDERIRDREFRLEELQSSLNKAYADVDLEKKIDELYKGYSISNRKVELLEKELAGKDLLIRQYQDEDLENKLLKQDYEQAKAMIDSLKDAIGKIMEQMEKQSESLKGYISRSLEDQKKLNHVASELNNVKFSNIELLDALNQLTMKHEKSIEERKALEKELVKLQNENQSFLQEIERISEEKLLLEKGIEELRKESTSKIYSLSDAMRKKAFERTDASSSDIENYDEAYNRAKELVKNFDI